MESYYTRELLIERYQEKDFNLWNKSGLLDDLSKGEKRELSQVLQKSIPILIKMHKDDKFQHKLTESVIMPLIRRIWYVLKSDSVFKNVKYGVTDYEGWTFNELIDIKQLNIPINVHGIINEIECFVLVPDFVGHPEIDYEAEVCKMVMHNYINAFLKNT